MVKKKWCRMIIVLLAVIALLAMYMIPFFRSAAVCRQIKNGDLIQTKMGDGTTAPPFLDEIAVVLQCDGPKIPLVEACYHRHKQAVDMLLRNGANPNFFFEGRLSPLEAVLKSGPIDEDVLEIIQKLVDAGADVNRCASSEPVILWLSNIMVLGGDAPIYEETLLFLLEHAGPEVEKLYSKVLLHMVLRGDTKMVDVLLERYDFNVDQVGYEGKSLLTLAVLHEDTQVAEELAFLLSESGADGAVTDDKGKTAIDYAQELGRQKIVQLLS